MKKNSIILGLILIIVGCIVLLKSFGILSFSWWVIWKMWPFVFIFIGIAILPIKKEMKGLFYVLSIVACVGMMMYVSKDRTPYRWEDRFRDFFDINKEEITKLKDNLLQYDQISYHGFSDSVTYLKVVADFSPGNYVLDSKPDKDMIRLFFQGVSYNTSNTDNGVTGVLNISPENWKKTKGKGEISLIEKFFYTFDVQGEESDVNIHGAHIKIDTLRINAKEKSVWQITLSDLTPETHVFIKSHANVEKIEIKIPDSSGYQFVSTMLSDDKQWNNLQPLEDGSYRSGNFMTAATRIFINSDTRNVELLHGEFR